VDSVLVFAEELERRDAEVARALAGVELLQAELEELRTHAAATEAFLDGLPGLRATREGEERAALAACAEAQSALRAADEELARARKENERLEAERARQQALDSIHAAELWLEQSRAALAAADAEEERRRRESEQLAARAVELAPRIRDVPTPGDGLAGTLDWASQARGALLLERSNLARDREEIVREANELTASLLGEPLVSSAVAGLRERLALALRDPSA
jgi:DNA repair exonuclease SbcCD ATPase subunit